MKFKDIIKDASTVLVIIPINEYQKVSINFLKELSPKDKICYITLNKTYNSLKDTFQKNNIDTDNIIFIDAISSIIQKSAHNTKGVYYASSPGALTEISLLISKIMKKYQFNYLIFDSISNLTTYSRISDIERFLSDLMNRNREHKFCKNAIFYALNVGSQKSMIQRLQMFVDKIINITED